MSTSRATWRRPSRSSSALALLALVLLGSSGARAGADRSFSLAFERTHGYDTSVWVARADGSASPDGRAVVYARYNGGFGRGLRGDVYAIRLADRHVSRLTYDRHNDLPVWGRRWIAYSHFHGAGAGGSPIRDLRLMRADGTGKRLLAAGHDKIGQAELGVEPVAFSQDGLRLLACLAAEFSCAPATFRLLDGSRHVLHGLAYGAAISSDGTQVLAGAGRLDGPWRVVIVPFAGGKARVLARNATGPTWTR